MKKDENEGRSVIKGSGFLRVDWGDEKNGSVMYMQGDTVVLGVKEIPSTLLTTLKFDKGILPEKVVEKLNQIQTLYLAGDYNTRRARDHGPYEIPLWINELTNLDVLYLTFFDLIGLTKLKLGNLNSLGLKNAYFADIDTILVEILALKNLTRIGYDASCTELIDQLKKHCSKEIEFIFLDDKT